jgi:hypothetical protein
LGDPNNTRRKSDATATAATARPAATAKAPFGCVLNEPKKVMSSAGKVASSGTPSTARPARIKSQVRIGIRGARPLSTCRLRDCARSARVAHAPTMSAPARPPAKNESTAPPMASGDRAARARTVMPPGISARFAAVCRRSVVRSATSAAYPTVNAASAARRGASR